MIHVTDRRLVFQRATYEKERKMCRLMDKRQSYFKKKANYK